MKIHIYWCVRKNRAFSIIGTYTDLNKIFMKPYDNIILQSISLEISKYQIIEKYIAISQLINIINGFDHII